MIFVIVDMVLGQKLSYSKNTHWNVQDFKINFILIFVIVDMVLGQKISYRKKTHWNVQDLTLSWYLW